MEKSTSELFQELIAGNEKLVAEMVFAQKVVLEMNVSLEKVSLLLEEQSKILGRCSDILKNILKDH
jgi:hypothetical protein